MTRHFEQEMAALKQKLLTMASHAESALANAIKALVDRDDNLTRKVIADDSILDHLEIEIDEMAIGLLALQGPVASDLRLITIAMKISHDSSVSAMKPRRLRAGRWSFRRNRSSSRMWTFRGCGIWRCRCSTKRWTRS
jgi:phosphate uptake regulator